MVLFFSCLLMCSNAGAISKLDNNEPPADFSQRAQKIKSQAEEKYSAAMQKMNGKVRKAFGAEGAALFKVVMKRGKNILKKAISGQLSSDDFSFSHMLDEMKSQVGDYKMDLATMMSLREDYLQALHEERAAKNAAMQKELTKLTAEREGLQKLLSQNTQENQYKNYLDLTEKEKKLQADLAASGTLVKTSKKQKKKAEKENKKLRDYILTINETLGGNITDDEKKVIKLYEDTIKFNEQTISRINNTTNEIESLAAELKNVQSAKKSLLNEMKTANTEDILEKLEEKNKAIASLEAQMVKVSAAEIKQARHEEKIEELSKKLNHIMAQLSADSLVNQLDIQADALFAKLEPKDDNSGMYTDGVRSLFLGEMETMNPETVARITKKRKEEFYDAYKNMIEVVLKTYKTTAQSSEESEGCLDASTQSDGVFGAMTMRVCADLQNTRTALQYSELLLAQLWFDAAADLQSWNDKYQMSDFDHDLTELNLDDYVMGKKTSIKSLLKMAKAKAKSASKDGVNKAQSALDAKLNEW